MKQSKALKRLNQWIDSHFHVMDGPPRAYFEIPTGLPQPHLRELRIQYSTILVGGTGRGVHKRLCDAVQAQIGKVYVPPPNFGQAHEIAEGEEVQYDHFNLPLLFWRQRPSIQRVGSTTRIRMRLAIPGFYIESAEGRGCASWV